MLIICPIDWREVGVAFGLQCLRNCTLSIVLLLYCFVAYDIRWREICVCAYIYAVVYVERCAIFVTCVRPRLYSEVGVSRRRPKLAYTYCSAGG